MRNNKKRKVIKASIRSSHRKLSQAFVSSRAMCNNLNHSIMACIDTEMKDPFGNLSHDCSLYYSYRDEIVPTVF